MKKIVTSGVIVVASFSMFASSAFAFERPLREAPPSGITKTEFSAERCELAKQRIDIVLQRHELNRTKREEIHARVSQKLSTFLDKMDELGLDTSNARNYVDQFTLLKNEQMALVDNKIALLKEAKESECGESFKSKVQEARDLNPQIRAKHLETKNYWLNTLKPEIKSLADQAKAMKSNES